jgi:hypothetical protein
MTQCAHVPKACPERAHGHGESSVPTCPLSLDRGTGTAHFKGSEVEPSVPQERRRLYRPAQLPSSPPIRGGRLRRVQVERVTPHRAEGFVAFNDGAEASVMRGPILDGLRLAERNGSMIDAELADYGGGWTVAGILPASKEWCVIEITHPKTGDILVFSQLATKSLSQGRTEPAMATPAPVSNGPITGEV